MDTEYQEVIVVEKTEIWAMLEHLTEDFGQEGLSEKEMRLDI